jgi:uncharacterized protein YbjT (DUF2867 family)
MNMGIDVVTGAFGYIGKYVTERLLESGRIIRTLTNHPNRPHTFGERVLPLPYNFERPDKLAESLQGAETLYNTYWVRFSYGTHTHQKAIENSRTLFQAAKKAGVQRIVHVSIANPSIDSPLAYYSGKARVEEALRETGVPYAIFRPSVVFGKEDILINNIAWMVRHFPVFAIPGNGQYELQPTYVEDLADAMVAAGQSKDNQVVNALGPEKYRFNDLVRLIAQHVGKPTRLLHLPATVTYGLTSLLGRWLGDIVLTKEEIQGLIDNLLTSPEPTLGQTPLSGWIEKNKEVLGVTYRSELKTHFGRI